MVLLTCGFERNANEWICKTEPCSEMTENTRGVTGEGREEGAN